MSDLTAFLLARYAEEEAIAGEVEWLLPDRQLHEAHCAQQVGECMEAACICGQPARTLLDLDAKRAVIEAAWADHVQIEGEWGSCQSQAEMTAVGDYPATLHHLAAPYADHPDYQPEWRVDA